MVCNYKKIATMALLFGASAQAQELFPVSDLASSVPKGALGVRLFNTGYQESNIYRSLGGLKLYYGATARLSVSATFSVSNIHKKTLPFDFITHAHTGSSFSGSTNTPEAGRPYPYIYNGTNLYAKYRFFTSDGQNTHFRMAAYSEISKIEVPSHVAEPDLAIHTGGIGGGVIATYLKKHFAVSFTGGVVLPFDSKTDAKDSYGGIYPTTISYGKAFNYDLSFGYLLYPRKYSNYNETNINIYCEFNGRTYGAADITQKDGPYSWAATYHISNNAPFLNSGSYLDCFPGIQLILKSVYRVEFAAGFPLIGKSYEHLYPVYMVAMQRYFFFGRKS